MRARAHVWCTRKPMLAAHVKLLRLAGISHHIGTKETKTEQYEQYEYA